MEDLQKTCKLSCLTSFTDTSMEDSQSSILSCHLKADFVDHFMFCVDWWVLYIHDNLCPSLDSWYSEQVVAYLCLAANTLLSQFARDVIFSILSNDVIIPSRTVPGGRLDVYVVVYLDQTNVVICSKGVMRSCVFPSHRTKFNPRIASRAINVRRGPIRLFSKLVARKEHTTPTMLLVVTWKWLTLQARW